MVRRKNVENERRRQIVKLILASTPEERKAIKRGLRSGRRLRRDVEKL